MVIWIRPSYSKFVKFYVIEIIAFTLDNGTVAGSALNAQGIGCGLIQLQNEQI